MEQDLCDSSNVAGYSTDAGNLKLDSSIHPDQEVSPRAASDAGAVRERQGPHYVACFRLPEAPQLTFHPQPCQRFIYPP